MRKEFVTDDPVSRILIQYPGLSKKCYNIPWETKIRLKGKRKGKRNSFLQTTLSLIISWINNVGIQGTNVISS